jgi:DNA-binding CsgD family transcriptional regulator
MDLTITQLHTIAAGKCCTVDGNPRVCHSKKRMPKLNTSREKLNRGDLRKRKAKGDVQTGVQRILSPNSAQALARRYQVFALRKDGYTIREIAETLNLSEESVHRDLKTVMSRLATELAENVEENRTLQIARLDALLKKYQGLAEAGNLSAASMVLAIETRRSKLLALDVPEQKKLEVTGIREYVGIDLNEV